MQERRLAGKTWFHAAVTLFLTVFLLRPLSASPLPSEFAAEDQELRRAIQKEIASCRQELQPGEKTGPLFENKGLCLQAVYDNSDGEPLWVKRSGPGEKARVIMNHLRASYREGLVPEDYQISRLEALWQAKEPADLARLDTLLTYSLARYMHDLSYGHFKLRLLNSDLFAGAGNVLFDPVQSIETARAVADLDAYLATLPPQHRYYTGLRDALALYRMKALREQMLPIPDGPLIRPGGTDQRLPVVRHRLGLAVDLPETQTTSNTYGPEMADAVRTYQRDHGLEADALIGLKTIEMLNQSALDRITAIKINMERWRWQDHQLGNTYVMVNIADFRLNAIRNDTVLLDMPVIVGERQHQTPVFSDTIRYLDFHPFWNVPPAIARNEMLPALRDNPAYLDERHIRLFSSWQPDAHELDSSMIDWNLVSGSQISRYLLRQDPGEWNALGRVKFVFPNHHSIYLHDTPAQDLFERSSRSFSHGCIRVSRPVDLALFCLQNNDSGWTLEGVIKIIEAGKRRVVSLNSPLTIHLTYQTAWVDISGTIHFNSDIYARDDEIIRVIAEQRQH